MHAAYQRLVPPAVDFELHTFLIGHLSTGRGVQVHAGCDNSWDTRVHIFNLKFVLAYQPCDWIIKCAYIYLQCHSESLGCMKLGEEARGKEI